jgi:hypothetical protein
VVGDAVDETGPVDEEGEDEHADDEKADGPGED